MPEKMKPFAIIVKMIVILLLPILFFTYVGHDPMKKQETATRNIAIVNEDVQAAYSKKPKEFGREVAAILDEDSGYDWSVVNRNTAEKGLENKEYDAVIYFPSDFSKNILTFNETEPIKAGVQYKIQTNLNAENLERVQKELEIAKNKMNKKVSTLYWSYVSQSVEDIRKKFDGILEKEIAFQETMYNFYTPSSEKLAGEISQHKKMLEGVFASTKDAGRTSNETVGEIEAAKAEVNSFVEDVNLYKEYQEAQTELFQKTSTENQQMLQDGISNYETMLSEGVQSVVMKQDDPKPEFDMNGNDMQQSVSGLSEKISESNASLDALTKDIEETKVGEQFDEVLRIQKDLIKEFKEKSDIVLLDDLQLELIELRKGLPSSSGDTDPSSPTTDIKEPSSPQAGEVTLDALKEQLSLLQKNVGSTKPEQQPDNWEAINKTLANLEASIKAVEGQVAQQAAAQKQMIIDYKELLKKLEEKLQNLDSGNPSDQIIREILTKEKDILGSPNLSERRKNTLAQYFQADIANGQIEKLMLYHGLLSSFHNAVQNSTDQKDRLIDGILENQEELGEIEKDFSATLKSTVDGLNTSASKISGVGADFSTFAETVSGFIAQYDESVSNEQQEILGELDSIQENAGLITANLVENTKVAETEQSPVDNLNGEILVTVQDNTAGSLKGISELINSLGERQTQVTEYTNELQAKVGSVQKRADDLNTNWAMNVDSTKKIKGDVYNVLNNTLVDDQQNGYVYDYLANPVQISGDVLEEKTDYTPPIIMLVIILISGLLIGFFLHLYSHVAPLVHAAIFSLLNFIVGLIISIYGLKIYPLEDMEALKWTAFTVLLLFVCSAIVRLAFYIGPFIGSILTIALILFFTTPLLDLIMPNFNVNHPVSDVYMSIQYGDSSSFVPAVAILAITAIIAAAVPYMRNRAIIKREIAHEG
ncbi:type VII secretion protein EsaA [Peribacillus glennii]|uniref:Type VII secretion protein EsaA n=1 Tax=Peribacillus glennii TaxID=2303991 RepID=A0A372LB84_9BACI|nr:type VII secretion protein EsaA [Peribacillus glennii]RFU63101.1 type VII secretion protein EsaA [Peribacillus glennii]